MRVRAAYRASEDGRIEMAKVAPYHTTTNEDFPPEHRDVYHDRDDCKAGKKIKPEHKNLVWPAVLAVRIARSLVRAPACLQLSI